MSGSARYSVEDVVKSYVWLGHRGFTELNAFHPEYRTGSENRDWNREQQTYPKIRYARSPDDAVRFVEKYAGERIVCFGLNPRSRVFKNSSGYPRAALDSEIEVSQNLLFDFDFENTPSIEHLSVFSDFLKRAKEHLQDLGFKLPTGAFTGRGYHLLFAYPAIRVSECPDIVARLRHFRSGFDDEHRREMESLDAKLDVTQDLRRMVRIYGTAKPEVGVVSEFYGKERVEDSRLRAYLLEMKVESEPMVAPAAKAGNAPVHSNVPVWFRTLLERDDGLRELWEGTGKRAGTDTSCSGFDYSLTSRLLHLGYRNIDELAAILVARPDGAVRSSGKGDSYVRRTIAAALVRLG